MTIQSSQPQSLSLTGGGLHESEVIGGIEPFFGVGVPLWKRSTDIVVASVLLVLLLPVFIGVAVLIKLVSRGPVIYRQDRLGVGGRKFSFLKFRTMQVADSDVCHQQYLQRLIACSDTSCPPPMKKLDTCNPNIIPLGRFLRSTCLDELPQLINVLRGEMSLVGPRPPIPYEVAAYMPWHSTRFSCLPGMTGLWQISGKNRLCFRDMIRLDIRYAREMSFWTDIEILLKTPFSIWREYSHAQDGWSARQKGQIKMLTMGVVGCGYWGPNLIRNFSSLSDCRIKYACDSDASRLSHMKALYPPNSDGHGVRLRSGAAIVANNTFENVYYPVALVLENNNLGGNCTSAMGFPEDQDFGPGKDACTVNDGCCDKIEHGYVWGNTQTSYGLAIQIEDDAGGLAQDRDYFLRAPSNAHDGFSWAPFRYPHPLVSNVGAPAPPTQVTVEKVPWTRAETVNHNV